MLVILASHKPLEFLDMNLSKSPINKLNKELDLLNRHLKVNNFRQCSLVGAFINKRARLLQSLVFLFFFETGSELFVQFVQLNEYLGLD